MKFKKALSIFLAITVIVGIMLTGSGNSEEEKEGTKNKAAEETAGTTGGAAAETTEEPQTANKIIVFQSKVEITDQMEALAKDYKKEKGVDVEVWSTTGDDYFQQVKVKLASNQGPTVFSLGPGAESQQMAAYLEDLGDLPFIGDIAEGMVNEVDGKKVGIPYTVEGFGMVCNKSMIDPAKVKDYDSFVSMLKEKKSKGVNGLSLSQESYFLIGHILNTPFALQKDPFDYVQKLAAGEVKMADTPEFQEFAKFYAAIRDNTKNPLEIKYDQECGDFATGKSAAIHQGNWSYGMFKDYKMDFEMGMMPLPIAGNDKIAVSVPTAWYVNSQAADAEKKAGKEFLTWLYTSPTGQRYLTEEFGFIPVIKGLESKNLDPLSKEVARYTAEGKTIPWPMNQWPAGIVDVYLVPIAEKFFTTDMTPEDFLKALDEAWAQAAKK